MKVNPTHVILNEVKDLLLVFCGGMESRSFTEFTLERSEGFRMTI
jgi:hypothetical protein